MNNLFPHIQYLLREHDCVIIPDWGAFVASVENAHIKDSMLYPPKRILGFNLDLKHNDGILVSCISRRDGITYQSATKVVNDAVEKMKDIYDLTGKLEIPRIGTFNRNGEGTMSFSPEKYDNIANTNYLGLASFPVTRQFIAEEEDVDGRKPIFISALRAFKWAAAIIVLFVLGITLTTPVALEKEKHYLASFFGTVENTNSNQENIIEPVHNEVDVQSTIITSDLVEYETNISPERRRMNLDDKYFLIVASFETRSQANKYISQHSSEELDILEYGGRNRVFAASGNSLEEARKCMDDKEFVSIHPDGWVFRK